jgi:hypothetical protein
MEEQKQGATGESRSETRARQKDGQGWGAQQLADSDHHITDGFDYRTRHNNSCINESFGGAGGCR